MGSVTLLQLVHAHEVHHVVEDVSSCAVYTPPLALVLQEISEMTASVLLCPWTFDLMWDVSMLTTRVYGTKVYFCDTRIA